MNLCEPVQVDSRCFFSMLLEASGCVWMLLNVSGYFWMLLDASKCFFWKLLEASACFWKLLGTSFNYKKTSVTLTRTRLKKMKQTKKVALVLSAAKWYLSTKFCLCAVTCQLIARVIACYDSRLLICMLW